MATTGFLHGIMLSSIIIILISSPIRGPSIAITLPYELVGPSIFIGYFDTGPRTDTEQTINR